MNCIDSHCWFFVNGFFSTSLFPSPLIFFRIFPLRLCQLLMPASLRLYVLVRGLVCLALGLVGSSPLRLSFVFLCGLGLRGGLCEVGGRRCMGCTWRGRGHVSHHRRTNVKQSLNLNCSALQYAGVRSTISCSRGWVVIGRLKFKMTSWKKASPSQLR